MTTRRDFLRLAGLSAAAAALPSWMPAARAGTAPGRPNLLWISCEDTSPWLGFCGEKYAATPNVDRLAREGVHYTKAFVAAPVCSPSRFAIITGLHATSMGTQRLRSAFPVPDFVRGFPSYLREAGYYCTNNVKTDYNTSAEPRIIRESWDECSAKAHWRNRKSKNRLGGPGQPFFAVVNLTETHQGQAFISQAKSNVAVPEQHDPAKAPLPPYYPDTALARGTMARVHDCITAMDKHAGAVLAELKQEGLEGDTIVFFWPDHGQGIPRGKRTLWDTGLRIPLVVYFPEKYRHLAPAQAGSTCDRMVSLVDFGPTVLSLLGLPVPPHMQGVAFLGAAAGAPRQYVYGARDRVDEVLELSRSVRDNRYLYIRNYMPDLSWNQPESYSDQLELRLEMMRLAAEGKLNEAQLTYAGPRKPAEALYDSDKDPWQIRNVADEAEYRPVLERMRKALRDWQVECRDLGFIHEWQAGKMCEGGRPLSEAAREEKDYALLRVLDTADRVGREEQTQEFVRRLSDSDPTVRYWAAIGLRVAGRDAAAAAGDALRQALQDASVPVQVEAAGILAAHLEDRDSLERLAGMIRGRDEHAALHAARTLQLMGEKARPVLPAMREAMTQGNDFTRWSLAAAVAKLAGPGESLPQSPQVTPKRKKGGAQ
ncbi:MAG: sulfatase-like hydrolase/transferase [Planctomycetota bacterium]|nr:sulfatase-like hydrolase/transferase [Planctomycetota bacterium]